MALAMLPRRPTWPASVLPVASLRAGCLTGAVVLALRALEGMLRGGEQTTAMAPAACDRGRCVRSWRKSFSARVSAARWNHEACVAWLVPFQGSGRGTTVVGVHAGSWCVGSTLSPRGGRGHRGFRELRVSSGYIALPLVIAAVREAVTAARRGSHTQCFVRRTDRRPPLLLLFSFLLFSASSLLRLLSPPPPPDFFDAKRL